MTKLNSCLGNCSYWLKFTIIVTGKKTSIMSVMNYIVLKLQPSKHTLLVTPQCVSSFLFSCTGCSFPLWLIPDRLDLTNPCFRSSSWRAEALLYAPVRGQQHHCSPSTRNSCPGVPCRWSVSIWKEGVVNHCNEM